MNDDNADDDDISAADIQPANRDTLASFSLGNEDEAEDANEDDKQEVIPFVTFFLCDVLNYFHLMKVVLSLFWKGSKLGGAVYRGDTSEVCNKANKTAC